MNPTPPDLPIRDCTVGGLLSAAARRFPDLDAVVAPARGTRWTYAELDARADAVAAAVVAHGLAPGDRAVVWATTQPDWVALQYGLARAGVVLVTANTALKTDEIGYVLRKSGAKAVFFGRGTRDREFGPLLDRLDEGELPMLRLRVGIDGGRAAGALDFHGFLREADVAARDEARSRAERLDRDDVINMQYTSGTTGFPKGVMLTHRNIVQNSGAMAPVLGFGPGQRLCVCVPLFHCFGCVVSTLGSHGSGLAMVLVESFDAEEVLDTIERERCDALYGVPTMFLAELAAQRSRPRDLSSLRVGIMAGAPCPAALVRAVRDELHLPGIVVAYGLTEASPGLTMARPDDPEVVRAETVGRALPGIELRVVDPATLRDVVPGAPGELWARGDNVMKGYDGEPEATAEALTPDGWLRTGDLATRDAGGVVRIVGRIKELILRGGENIAPAEVEDAARRHPAVQDAAAFGIPSDFFGEEVGLAVRVRPDQAFDPEELRAFLARRIADPKVPARVFVVDAFPLTASGKVQRYRLRDLLDAAG